MALRFEWDPLKAEENDRMHGVSFDEARTAFSDPLAGIFEDPDHSFSEAREIIIGYSAAERLLIVSFTERLPDTIRIISARPVTRTERKDHERNRKT